MFSLIVTVLFGLGFAYFATQNTAWTTMRFSDMYQVSLPFYVIVLGSILIGLFISWVISLVNAFSSSMTIHGKDNKIRQLDKEVHQLELRAEELKEENAQLKGETRKTHVIEEEKPQEHMNFFDKLRYRLSS